MPATTPAPTISTVSRPGRAIAVWLLIMCAMIFVMVVLGGVTRLMHAGLSMVEWRPFLGWLPPFGDAAWADIFAQYRAFPEYQKLNYGMTLAEFKSIFWFEYFHRLWGRLIGLAFLLPLLYFLFTGQVEGRMRRHLFVIFVLGGLQGVLGWYMVKSGLVDRPDVSQYRLTAHLGAAFLIYAYIFWVALGLLYPTADTLSGRAAAGLRWVSIGLVGLVSLTALSGGFVAGLDAGFTFNTFPLMNGQLVPEGLFEHEPWLLNFFDNVTTVQFDHRLLAIVTFVCVAVFWWRARYVDMPNSAQWSIHALMGMTLIQVALGIVTLLLVVPVALGAAHQAGALLLFTASLWTAHTLRGARRSSA